MTSKRWKLVSAGIGACAAIAMGALGGLSTSASEPTPIGPQAAPPDDPEITLGETSTTTTGQTEPATPLASPEVTAEPAPSADVP